MASFNYLWQNRAIFPLNSIKFYKAWAKRILLIKDILIRNYRRKMLIRQGAIIDQTCELGNVRIDGHKENLKIGANSFIGRVNIALHFEVEIGNNVCINDGVNLLTGSHNVSDPNWTLVGSKIDIGDFVWIGINAIILPGVKIGKGAVIGAGAVVSKNVEERQIVVGNPAKKITKERCVNFDYNPCEFLSANRAWLIG